MNIKYLTGIILLLILLGGYLLVQKNSADSSLESGQEVECFSWSTYNPSVKAWHWRAEKLNEYFPTREDSVANCMSMLNGTIN